MLAWSIAEPAVPAIEEIIIDSRLRFAWNQFSETEKDEMRGRFRDEILRLEREEDRGRTGA